MAVKAIKIFFKPILCNFIQNDKRKEIKENSNNHKNPLNINKKSV